MKPFTPIILFSSLLGALLGISVATAITHWPRLHEAWNAMVVCKHDGRLTGINEKRVWNVDISPWTCTADGGSTMMLRVCKDCGKTLDITTRGRGFYSQWPVEGSPFVVLKAEKVVHTCTPEELQIWKAEAEMLHLIELNLRYGARISRRTDTDKYEFKLGVTLEDGKAVKNWSGILFDATEDTTNEHLGEQK